MASPVKHAYWSKVAYDGNKTSHIWKRPDGTKVAVTGVADARCFVPKNAEYLGEVTEWIETITSLEDCKAGALRLIHK
jgi:hypothetical protein